MYYTWDNNAAGEEGDNSVRVATAPADDENWPAKLEYRGVAFERGDGEAEDSGDVAYLEAYDRFIFVNVSRRYMDNCRIAVRQSADGITWDEEVSYTSTNFTKYAHNGGLSKRSDGHIRKGDPVYFAYAHAENSNATVVNWATRICKVTFKVSEKVETDRGITRLQKVPSQATTTGSAPQSVFVSDPYVRIRMGKPAHQLRIKLLDNNMETRVLSASEIANIEFYGYDTSIVDISESGLVTAKKTGMTHVYMKYGGDDRLSDNFIVYVGEGAFTEAIGSNAAGLDALTDSDVDTVYNTQANGEKWMGLQTADGKNAPLKGVHLYSQIEAGFYPATFKVQVRSAGGEWTDTEKWSYHFLSEPSTSTAIVPVTIVFDETISANRRTHRGRGSDRNDGDRTFGHGGVCRRRRDFRNFRTGDEIRNSSAYRRYFPVEVICALSFSVSIRDLFPRAGRDLRKLRYFCDFCRRKRTCYGKSEGRNDDHGGLERYADTRPRDRGLNIIIRRIL